MSHFCEEKAKIRDRMRLVRDEAAARDPDAGEKLADVFPMRLLERYGPVVAGYVPIQSEMDPLPLLRRMQARGAKICLPRIETEGGLSFRAWTIGAPLEKAKFGVMQPSKEAPPATPTLVLVPLLAFDARGNRIGYGQGHYDGALAALRTQGRAFACATAFHAQMQETVPEESHDQPLDWAVTERGSLPLFMMRAAG